MEELMVQEDTLPKAYHMALVLLDKCGDVTECSDWSCKQKEVSMTMIVNEPLKEPMISRCFIGGPEELEQYVLEILDGILDFEIAKGNWSYTYHDRYIDQFPFIVEELKRNPSSRRAVMDIRTKADVGSNDPACLQHIQYFIRNNKLHCKVLFRSNDAVKATFMNAFALIMLQKRVADELCIEVGTYTHRANSFHCYEKDFELLKAYTEAIKMKKENTYNYADDWKEMMEDSIDEIMEKVDKLR